MHGKNIQLLASRCFPMFGIATLEATKGFRIGNQGGGGGLGGAKLFFRGPFGPNLEGAFEVVLSGSRLEKSSVFAQRV